MNREELIATVSRITELRTQIAQLAGLQKELRQLEAQLDSVPGVTGSPAPAKQRQTASIEDKLWQFLESNSGKDWSGEELAQQIGAKVPSVRASLSKLRKAGRITDTRRGHVQAKAAAPNDKTEEDTRLVPHAA
jgi:biotin operon repressor